jgi:hypothetical protein
MGQKGTESEGKRRLGWRDLVGALIVFGLLAVVATYPLAFKAGSHVFGLGTPPLNVWAMGVVLHQLGHDPIHLFDGNAFYPHHYSLAFSEHLFVPALLGSPVALATGNLVLAHNLVALATFMLAGLGMYLLAFELTSSRLGAYAAGLLYAFHTFNVNELIRLQILSNQYFPFLLVFLIRYLRSPSWARAWLAAGAYVMQGLSCMYWALYSPILVGPLLLAFKWRLGVDWRRLVPLAVTLALALLVVGVFFIPYLITSQQYGFARELSNSLPIERYWSVLPGSLLYSGVLSTASPNESAAHFLGFVALALGLIGVVHARRNDLAAYRPILLALLLLGGLLSLGPEIVLYGRTFGPGPYRAFFEWAPGFRHVRYPERFSIFVVLALGPFVASGTAWLEARIGRWVAGAVIVLLFLEHVAIPLPLNPLPGGSDIPEVYRWLRDQADVHAVASLPSSHYNMERLDGFPMYLSTAHWKPIVEGFSGHFPPEYNFTKWRLFHFPSAASVEFLQGFGVDTLVVRPHDGQLPAWVSADPRWDLQRMFADGHAVLRLKHGERTDPGPDVQSGEIVELPRASWTVNSSSSTFDPTQAIDGNPATSWCTDDIQRKGDFLLLRFAEPTEVCRVSMACDGSFTFPMRLKVLGLSRDDRWEEIPFDERAAYRGLFDTLLDRPATSGLDLDLPCQTLQGLRLRIREDDAFNMPWCMSEVRLRGPGQGR